MTGDDCADDTHPVFSSSSSKKVVKNSASDHSPQLPPHYLKATSSSESKKMENKNHSGVSWLRRIKSVSRNSRNVGFLIRKTSFKPNRGALLECPSISEGVAFDKATHSSALKGSNFVETDGGGAQIDQNSTINFCRYHHCSLHGHRHDGSTYRSDYLLVKRGRFNQRRKVVKSKKELRVAETDSIVAPLYGEHNKAAVDSIQMHDLSLIETAFGEASFPERAHQDSVEIMSKYEQQTQMAFGTKGYCLRCYSLSLLNDQSEEPANKAVNRNQEATAVSNKLVKNKSLVDGLAADSRDSFKVESAYCGDTNVDEVLLVDDEDSKNNRTTRDALKLQLSKPRHVSLWKLIHQNLSSASVAESSHNPVAESDNENSRAGADTLPIVEASAPPKELSESDAVIESEVRDTEDRKLMAVKLVREAIEKILLPEVQDLTPSPGTQTHPSTGSYANGSECIKHHEKEGSTQENEVSDAVKGELMAASGQLEQVPLPGDSGSEGLKGVSRIFSRKSGKGALNHWSNLKKWILLQNFIRELEKVRAFDVRSPKIQPSNSDPDAEKHTLRPPALDGRKSVEEWMLDYALRQAVGQLAPTQKKKVALLVKAFETVVPPQEDSHAHIHIIPWINDNELVTGTAKERVSEVQGPCEDDGKSSSSDDVLLSLENHETGNQLIKEATVVGVSNEKFCEPSSFNNRSLSRDTKQGNEGADHLVKCREFDYGSSANDGNSISSTPKFPESKLANGVGSASQTEKTNHIKMWHMVYHHVVSSVAEKVGGDLLDGSETEETEKENASSATNADDAPEEVHEKALEPSNERTVLTKDEVVKLIRETVNEILLAREESFRSQSPRYEYVSTSEPISFEQRSPQRADSEASREVPKPRNWSILKNLVLVKRSIKALEVARKLKKEADPEPETVMLKSQIADERKKAEQWMLDYTVQNIVTKLTPARTRRVAMLVEAFEAVIPLPET